MDAGRDLLVKQIRDCLNAEKIKLWMPPYTTPDRSKGESPDTLVVKYSEQFGASAEDVAHILEELRLHALAKLDEREKFQSHGLATLRVRIVGPIPADKASKKPLPLECKLDIAGSDLKDMVSAQYSLSPLLLKMICRGRVITERKTLEEQGIKNGSDIMAIVMTSSEAQIARKEAEVAEVEKTRQTAELLSARGDDDEDFDIQIADQNGKPLALPAEEKKALTLAMALHEKGRAALRTHKFSLALPLFLEADVEFSKCSSQILNSVDNYAILCLDIVWCYLQLKNLDQLPNADARLQASEAGFKRSYGEKMERLAALKGGTGTEQALLMRLYLLQGIVAFHKGDMREAGILFKRAEFVLTLLHVDENSLNEIMLMGFSEKEARLALRSKSGNVQGAVDFIMEKRKEKEEINKKSKQAWQQRVRGKKLGKTVSGAMVNVDHFDSLVSMDFPPGAAAEALRQADNSISLAIEVLNSRPELLALPDPESKKIDITDDMIQQVVSLGFEVEFARRALEISRGSIQRAVDQLLRSGGVLPALSSAASTSASASSASDSASFTSASSSESETSGAEDKEMQRQQRKEEKANLKSFMSDISEDFSDHLDLALVEEKDILQTYKALIKDWSTSRPA
ncbi:NEDD8 ultimate buster 1-like [Elysia marginata]|uniref:NEDD8 ultimate buster 1-like n=1 Tax=Elysia marginata TaxID=1093978 RepID=A0AAV4FYG9_9GAST|nr:NEDD8 ultimate buster 1-like [Elysia marginata]